VAVEFGDWLKVQQIAASSKGVYYRTDPEVKTIVTLQQYHKASEIRRTEIEQAIRQNW